MRPYSGETRGVKPTLTGRIYYGNTYVDVTDRDMEARSFSMQTGTSVPGSLSVGAAVMGSVRFTLINRDGKFDNVAWKGSTFDFVITTENGNITNNFNMGTYYIANHTETGDRIQVEAYDAFRLMDETPIYEDIQNYGLFPSGQAAQSMGDAINCIVTAVNARYNVGLTTTGLATPNTALIKPANDQMSERQLISYIAQLCGQYVIIRVNSNGSPILKFGWYNTTSAFDAGTTFSHTLRTNDITVTGVKLSTYSGNNSYELGNTNGSVIVVDTNPLITDVALMRMYAQRIYNAVNGLTFRPGSATIRGTPAFEAGDYIKVSTLNEDNVYTIITNLTYTFDLTIDVTADAPPYEGDLALIRSRYIRDAAKQAVSEELNDSTSELSEAIAAAGGGGDGDECEWIKLDGCFIWMKASSSLVHTYEKFNGVTLELVKQDNYHSDVTQMVSRVPGNTTQLSDFNSEDGIDIVKVQYLTQWIKVPVNDQDIRWLDVWVGDVTQPTLNDYKETYGNSFPEAVRQARRCNFECSSTQPGRVRIQVKRFKDDNNSFSKDFIAFGDSGSYYYEPYRPKALYNGLQLLTTEHINYAPKGRIPYVAFYFPGHVYDLDEDNTSTYHKWCYIHRDSMGSPSVLELIPPYYFTTYTS